MRLHTHTYTLTICNTYCFSTVRMVAETCLTFTSIRTLPVVFYLWHVQVLLSEAFDLFLFDLHLSVPTVVINTEYFFGMKEQKMKYRHAENKVVGRNASGDLWPKSKVYVRRHSREWVIYINCLVYNEWHIHEFSHGRLWTRHFIFWFREIREIPGLAVNTSDSLIR